MGKFDRLIEQILNGTSDNNFAFTDLQNVLEYLGFACRIKGSHFIYKKDVFPERINIQPNGSKAKSYQVRQVRNLINKYGLGGESDD